MRHTACMELRSTRPRDGSNLWGRRGRLRAVLPELKPPSNKGIRGGGQGRDLGRWSVTPYIVSRSGKVASTVFVLDSTERATYRSDEARLNPTRQVEGGRHATRGNNIHR